MTSLGPWHGGRRGGGGVERWETPFFTSPFSSDAIFDPWDFGPAAMMPRGGDRGREDITALAHANVDWRETDKAHIFRVDLPGSLQILLS